MFTELSVSIAIFFVSLLTFYSGFGLGTLSMPIIAIFFPISFAIALTAIMHLLNNCLKFFLLCRNVNWKIVGLLGIPAILAAFVGSWLLVIFSSSTLSYSYSLFIIDATITPVKVVVGGLLIFFAITELFPQLKKIFLFTQSLYIGGILSGFFGGLSGHQGAFRSAYLIQTDLNKNEFIATSAVIAILVDITRLLVYGININSLTTLTIPTRLIVLIVFSGFLGTLVGRYTLKKVTITLIHNIVAVMLYVFGIALVIGLI